jgi:hypothetical protein
MNAVAPSRVGNRGVDDVCFFPAEPHEPRSIGTLAPIFFLLLEHEHHRRVLRFILAFWSSPSPNLPPIEAQ